MKIQEEWELYKPKKKTWGRFLRVIFGRTTFVITALLIQLVILCLSFLLMIGLSLVAEGFGFHIPKGYLYAAIGFSILIELLNQIARRNFIKQQSNQPLRARTADAILRLMGGRRQVNVQA